MSQYRITGGFKGVAEEDLKKKQAEIFLTRKIHKI